MKTVIKKALSQIFPGLRKQGEQPADNRIPFNLERAINGDPVVTRSGKKVKNIEWHDPKDHGYVIFPIVSNVDGILGHVRFTPEGRYFNNDVNSDLDLFMKYPEPEAKVWPHVNDSVRITTNHRIQDQIHRDILIIDEAIQNAVGVLEEMIISCCPGKPNIAKVKLADKSIWVLLDDIRSLAL